MHQNSTKVKLHMVSHKIDLKCKLITLKKKNENETKTYLKCTYIEDSFIEISSFNEKVKGCGWSSQPRYGELLRAKVG